jgi:hypothetical protein
MMAVQEWVEHAADERVGGRPRRRSLRRCTAVGTNGLPAALSAGCKIVLALRVLVVLLRRPFRRVWSAPISRAAFLVVELGQRPDRRQRSPSR